METVQDIRQILSQLPHRYPFLLVDRVIEKHVTPAGTSRAGQKIVCLKNVSFNEPFFQGHFPGLPIMPGVLQVEALAQASCLAYSRAGDPEMDFFIGSIQEAKFRRPVTPGDTLTLTAEILKDRGSIIQIKTEARVGDDIACEATILAKATPRDQRGKT